MFVLLLHFAEAREDAIHLLGLVRIRHGTLQRLELVMQVTEPAAAGDRLIQYRAARHFADVLSEVADAEALRDGDLAFIHRLLADNHAEQRRLAGTVGTHE